MEVVTGLSMSRGADETSTPHVAALFVAFLLTLASLFIFYRCTAGSANQTNRFGAVVLLDESAPALRSPPTVGVAVVGRIPRKQREFLKSAGFDPRFPMAMMRVPAKDGTKFDIVVAGVGPKSCTVADDSVARIISSEPLDGASLISYDRNISTDVMSESLNPRSGMIFHMKALHVVGDDPSLMCSVSAPPISQTAASRLFSIDTALAIRGFSSGRRPVSAKAERLVLPETVWFLPPSEAAHVTYDGAAAAGEYIPDADDASSPTDAFTLTSDAPVLTIQWDDVHADAVTNFGLFVAGGLFGLAIGVLGDSLKAALSWAIYRLRRSAGA